MCEDVADFFFEGEDVPFTAEDPLANCSSREEFQDTVRFMGNVDRHNPLLFADRFPSMPGVTFDPVHGFVDVKGWLKDNCPQILVHVPKLFQISRLVCIVWLNVCELQAM